MMMSITFDTSASNWYSSPVEAEVSSATAASATRSATAGRGDEAEAARAASGVLGVEPSVKQ